MGIGEGFKIRIKENACEGVGKSLGPMWVLTKLLARFDEKANTVTPFA